MQGLPDDEGEVVFVLERYDGDAVAAALNLHYISRWRYWRASSMWAGSMVSEPVVLVPGDPSWYGGRGLF